MFDKEIINENIFNMAEFNITELEEEISRLDTYEDVDEEILNEIRLPESKVQPASTKKQTEKYVKNFKTFLESKNCLIFTFPYAQ